MSDFYLGLFSGLFLFMLIEPLIVNFIYFTNIDLFLDLILLKKKKDKLIKHILNKYRK